MVRVSPVDPGGAPTRRQLRERAHARTMPPAPDDPLAGAGDTAPRGASGSRIPTAGVPGVAGRDRSSAVVSSTVSSSTGQPGTAQSGTVLSDLGLAGPALSSTAFSNTAQWADADRPATALVWVDPVAVAQAETARTAPRDEERDPDLLREAPRRSLWRPAVIAPALVLAALAGGYAATTLLWPLHSLAPSVSAVPLSIEAAPASVPVWPANGNAAVDVQGFDELVTTDAAVPIASITKLVSSLMVLERMPLQPGEQGPSYAFTAEDSEAYWDYLIDDQSALDVPVDGTLTQYQLLQGTLLGSANNYIDFLAGEIWGSERAFADAARIWLDERGLSGITVVSPSGLDEGNTATPAALLHLARRALQNPVIAEIVATPAAEIPGAGLVTNTNALIADPGVIGLKTGALTDYYGLLAAKDVVVDGATVRVYAAALGQPDNDLRFAETRALFDQVEAELQAQAPAVPRGTVVGQATTRWGATAELVTTADARPVLWNGGTAGAAADLALGEDWSAGGAAGSLRVTGPVDERTVDVSLAEELAEPSPWWRLTHPLQLFGLAE